MARVVITGAAGYVGSAVARRFDGAGWEVLALGRGPKADVAYRLEEVPAVDWTSVDALVHCAYDFKLMRWEDIERVNVRGSIRLLKGARAGGVKKGVFISSLSSFASCRSLYGQAKLAVESEALELGFAVLRPGLVYGNRPGGMMGGLEAAVRSAPVVPLIGDGSSPQYPVHEADLAEAVFQLCQPGAEVPDEPVSLAAGEAISFRELLRRIAARHGAKPIFLPVPWRLILLGLRTLEMAGLHPPFRSDSLIGFVFQNPDPDFEPARRLGLHCRPFA